MNRLVNINVHDMSGECCEADAARELRDIILRTIPDEATGSIDIISGVNLPFGKVSDIDILVTAELDNCSVETSEGTVAVKSFCMAIEVKDQPAADVFVNATDIFVNYPSTGEKKNASGQNRNQKFAVLHYCQQHCYNVYISNAVWLRSVTPEIWDARGWSTKCPCLLSAFTFADLIEQIIVSGQIPFYSGLDAVGKTGARNALACLVSDLTELRPIAPPMLRRKTEQLVAGMLADNVRTILTADGFSCVDGKAGTGKTFLLLQTALKRADEGYGCVLLTYNNVLKMDLQRLVSFFPASSDARNNLSIQTIHSYLYSLAATLGADNGLNGLKDHVDRLWKRNGRRAFAADSALDLDKILLIDEAQDCTPDEKEIFEKVFGRDNVIVAKSAWQKVRRQSVAKWGRPTVRLSVGLRQKANIVQFLKTLAGEMGISDTCAGCDPAPGLVEGKVMILQDYTGGLHHRLEDECREAGGSNYDILVLVSPTYVYDKCFVKADLWRGKEGISLIDGTDTKALASCSCRELLDSCRVFQYQSCRGLEGWATVCYCLDDLYDIKYNESGADESPAIEDPAKARHESACQWIMMPLTRAIDTLVITVGDTSSDFAGMLRRAAARHSDFVECRI